MHVEVIFKTIINRGGWRDIKGGNILCLTRTGEMIYHTCHKLHIYNVIPIANTKMDI